MEWIKANVLPLISALWLLWLLYRSWRQEVRQKSLENNHLHTIENDLVDIKKRLDNLEKTLVNHGERISKIEGRLNGRQ